MRHTSAASSAAKVALGVALGVTVGIALGLTLGLGGCARAPLSVGQPLQAQNELQSATHWRTLASDVGLRLRETFKRVPPGARLYVQGHADNLDFEEVFRGALAEELRRRGLEVVNRKADAHFTLAYGTRITDHALDTDLPLGSITAATAAIRGIVELATVSETGAILATGAFLDLARGGLTPDDLAEVTVSLSLMGRDGAVSTKALTYYITRANARHYPNLPLPPLYAVPANRLPEPPVTYIAVEE
ncbi:hypothetical protein [Roseospira visakhapatnamensis]|uniref:Uncharacterized protein n=1 Tax=Roseospira visakhapatnamensis TaxID=390880 RepID=A0A7W6W8L6_9PROT|nr:hypothetical protein [Roseospira visakhapatnamensis]MBB4265130.1 hypothetical protein [Roseospira visakhapatnamensis]